MFTATLSDLVAKYGSEADHQQLRAAYKHFEVLVASEAELRAACVGDLARQRFMLEVEQAFEELSAAHVRRLAAEDVGGPTAANEMIEGLAEVPATSDAGGLTRTFRPAWGDWVWLARTRTSTRAFGLDRLAKIVRQVEPCTRRDLEVLQTLEHPPADKHMLRVGLCVAVWANMDPVWARTRYGLVRWACDLELDDLRAINRAWVERVEHLNRLIDTRPPLWEVAGDR